MNTTTGMNENDEIVATGIIVPAAWDADGNPTAFVIATYEEKEYLIDMGSPEGLRLAGMSGRRVRLAGTAGGMGENRPILQVARLDEL